MLCCAALRLQGSIGLDGATQASSPAAPLSTPQCCVLPNFCQVHSWRGRRAGVLGRHEPRQLGGNARLGAYGAGGSSRLSGCLHGDCPRGQQASGRKPASMPGVRLALPPKLPCRWRLFICTGGGCEGRGPSGAHLPGCMQERPRPAPRPGEAGRCLVGLHRSCNPAAAQLAQLAVLAPLWITLLLFVFSTWQQNCRFFL